MGLLEKTGRRTKGTGEIVEVRVSQQSRFIESPRRCEHRIPHISDGTGSHHGIQ